MPVLNRFGTPSLWKPSREEAHTVYLDIILSFRSNKASFIKRAILKSKTSAPLFDHFTAQHKGGLWGLFNSPPQLRHNYPTISTQHATPTEHIITSTSLTTRTNPRCQIKEDRVCKKTKWRPEQKVNCANGESNPGPKQIREDVYLDVGSLDFTTKPLALVF
ncbi:hypothetical protein BOTCAL_0074g00090 [Botryotinia calthae]|uniref:Uncharacterized protein n=1 Tax=Botryotinia calthae TaxID=38488 RepID=A0A4Y8DAW7_9HELO|nr:hypothetical protein BOTCAL_0074g00090 [Botryotinia calthae]